MRSVVAAGSVGVLLIVAAVIVARTARRRRTRRRVPDRAELLRQGTLAVGLIAKDSRRARRGSIRRDGLGEGSHVNHAASFGTDGAGPI